MTRLAFLAVALLTSGALAACGQAKSPAVSSSPTPDNRIVVQRTGGLAGVNDTFVVEPDGSWTKSGGRGASATSGHLTDEQRNKLRSLATDPHLRDESATGSGKTKCADAFTYTVSVGDTKITYTDCPSDGAPPATASSIVTLLTQAAS